MLRAHTEDSADAHLLPLALTASPRSQRNEEMASLLTPVVSECVSAVSTLLAPPPQGEMVASAVPNSQPVPFVNPTCLKATCGGALLLAGLAGYGARAFMQASPAAAPEDVAADATQQAAFQPTKQRRQKRREAPRPVARVLQESGRLSRPRSTVRREAPRPVARVLQEGCDEKPAGPPRSAKRTEICSIQVGQGGNKIGNAFWTGLLTDHHISFGDGKYDGDATDVDLLRAGVYMKSSGEHKYAPRAILVDLEPNTEDVIKASQVGPLFKPDNMVFGANGTGGNFAKGYYTEGAEYAEEILDIVRKEVEDCDNPQGFHLFQTMGGGCGSGLGTLLLMKLRDQYPDQMFSTFSVFPSPKVSDTANEPYNAVLASSQLIEYADMTYVIDNEALYNISSNVLKVAEPKYTDLNSIATQSLMGVTAPFRFSGAADDDLRKQSMSLVPFPRLHFLMLSHAPFTDKDGSLSTGDLVGRVRNPRNFLANIKPADGKYLAEAYSWRGQVDQDDFFKALYKDGEQEGSVEWIPDNVMGSVLEKPPSDTKASCTRLANTTAMKGVFQRLATQFGAMYRRKSFLHWYTGQGMDEMEFQEADKNVRDLITEYQDKEEATWDDYDNDEYAD